MKKLIAIFVILLTLFPMKASGDITEYLNDRCGKKCFHVNTMINEAVQIASESHKVNPDVIIAVMQVESKFNPKAENMSSKGLMQVNLRYHRKKFSGTNPFNIYANVYVGTSILKECMDRRGNNLTRALKCYNGGGDPGYVKKVMTALNNVRSQKLIVTQGNQNG
jgi:soluble lytic murein transglycosylase-like protein